MNNQKQVYLGYDNPQWTGNSWDYRHKKFDEPQVDYYRQLRGTQAASDLVGKLSIMNPVVSQGVVPQGKEVLRQAHRDAVNSYPSGSYSFNTVPRPGDRMIDGSEGTVRGINNSVDSWIAPAPAYNFNAPTQQLIDRQYIVTPNTDGMSYYNYTRTEPLETYIPVDKDSPPWATLLNIHNTDAPNNLGSTHQINGPIINEWNRESRETTEEQIIDVVNTTDAPHYTDMDQSTTSWTTLVNSGTEHHVKRVGSSVARTTRFQVMREDTELNIRMAQSVTGYLPGTSTGTSGQPTGANQHLLKVWENRVEEPAQTTCERTKTPPTPPSPRKLKNPKKKFYPTSRGKRMSTIIQRCNGDHMKTDEDYYALTTEAKSRLCTKCLPPSLVKKFSERLDSRRCTESAVAQVKRIIEEVNKQLHDEFVEATGSDEKKESPYTIKK